MIPAEAVAAAAEAMANTFAQMDDNGELSWERCALTALEAAAPHMHRDWLETNKQGEK